VLGGGKKGLPKRRTALGSIDPNALKTASPNPTNPKKGTFFSNQSKKRYVLLSAVT
jgi:hypothetical protein